MNNKQLIWVIIFILLSLVPFGMYFCIFHGTLSSDSNEWANAGTFICSFSALALTALNVYAMFAINNSLQKSQDDQYKLKLLYDFIDAYRDFQLEMSKSTRNIEVCISCASKAYHLSLLISEMKKLFPSSNKSKDLERYSEILANLSTGMDTKFFPVHDNGKAYTIAELLEEMKTLFDTITTTMRKDITIGR